MTVPKRVDEMSPGEMAAHYLKYATGTGPGGSPIRTTYALTSIAASLVSAEAFQRGETSAQENATTYCRHPEAQAMLHRVESLEVRADLSEALGRPLEITPEEPDPGRDWSHVEGHLFRSSGKWDYQVWLDYTGERVTVDPVHASGVGPAGWHWDGREMAKRALHRATTKATSGVSIPVLGAYWTLFVPHPPQGYPLWVQPDEPTSTGDGQETLETQARKLREIRAILERPLSRLRGGMDADVLAQEIKEVLDR